MWTKRLERGRFKGTHDRLVREIATGADAAVVFVNYTPSPEARFAVAIEQAYAATKYIAEHGLTLGIDGSRPSLVTALGVTWRPR